MEEGVEKDGEDLTGLLHHLLKFELTDIHTVAEVVSQLESSGDENGTEE
jgi:hypothetical protein